MEGINDQGPVEWQGHKAGWREVYLGREKGTSDTCETVIMSKPPRWWILISCGSDVCCWEGSKKGTNLMMQDRRNHCKGNIYKEDSRQDLKDRERLRPITARGQVLPWTQASRGGRVQKSSSTASISENQEANTAAGREERGRVSEGRNRKCNDSAQDKACWPSEETTNSA